MEGGRNTMAKETKANHVVHAMDVVSAMDLEKNPPTLCKHQAGFRM